MTSVKMVQGKYEIYNGAGLQAKGSNAPNQEGLSPKELLEAALGLCVTISLQKVLERDQVAYDPSSIQVDVAAIKAEGVTNRFTDFDVRVRLPENLDEAYRKKLMIVVERACTIGNTIKSGAKIETTEA